MKNETPQMMQPQYQLICSSKPLEIKFMHHFSHIICHTPSKRTTQTTKGKQGKRKLYRKMGEYHIERWEKEERGYEVGK